MKETKNNFVLLMA